MKITEYHTDLSELDMALWINRYVMNEVGRVMNEFSNQIAIILRVNINMWVSMRSGNFTSLGSRRWLTGISQVPLLITIPVLTVTESNSRNTYLDRYKCLSFN